MQDKEILTAQLEILESISMQVDEILDSNADENQTGDVFYILEMNDNATEESVGICKSLSSLKRRLKCFIGTDEPISEFIDSGDDEEYCEFTTICNEFMVKIHTLPLCDYKETVEGSKVIVIEEDDRVSERHIAYTYPCQTKTIEEQVSDELKIAYPWHTEINSENSKDFGISFVVRDYDYIEQY